MTTQTIRPARTGRRTRRTTSEPGRPARCESLRAALARAPPPRRGTRGAVAVTARPMRLAW